jgi:hypothetical protein
MEFDISYSGPARVVLDFVTKPFSISVQVAIEDLKLQGKVS